MGGIYSDYIQSRALGTSSLSRVQLSGDLSTNAADWTVPTGCQGLLWVQPILNIVTPTANEATTASLAVDSSSLGLPPFEVLSVPLKAAVATTDAGTVGDQDMSVATYPMMFDAKDSKAGMAGSKVSFYGIPQVANTGVPWLGAKIWWTDIPGLASTLRTAGGNPDRPYSALIGGAYEGAGASTSTGTAVGSVTGKNATVSGSTDRTMRGLFGICTPVTPVTLRPFTGAFIWTAPELPYIQRVGMEPLGGNLGTSQQASRLTTEFRVSFTFKTPSTILMNAFFDQVSTTAGNFMQGILYQ